jgi:hypothetical protein
MSQKRFEVRFAVFPLFLAGIFTTDQSEKDMALNLTAAVEPHSYGRSIKEILALLQTIYHKQLASLSQTGVATSVDWVAEVELSGQRLVITGL